MAKRELQIFDRYRYGKRSYLYAGDRFRAGGGPYYVGQDENGKRVRIPMGEGGVFIFRRYCELGASKWIEATSEKSGTTVIYVGGSRPSPRVEGLRLRPHRIRPVYERKKRRGKVAPSCLQRTLFDL